jgi:hydroxymethylbilane synthase
MLPAVGQGALGIETRADDHAARSIVSRLDDSETRAAVLAERALLADLRCGCLAPVGAWGRIHGAAIHLSAAVLSVDGRRRVSVSVWGSRPDPEQIGRLAAQELLALGAAALIADSRS